MRHGERGPVACALTLVLLATAACSSGGGQRTAPTTPAQGVATTQGPADPTFSGDGSAEFCSLSRTYTERSNGVGASATSAQLRALALEGQTAIVQAAKVAPAEIKADAQVISTAFGSVLVELEKVNYDPTKMTPSTFAALQAPEFGRSTQRFQAYLRDICKITG
jgi:hypothetical protein